MEIQMERESKKQRSVFTQMDENDLEVAGILLDLPKLILSRRAPSLTWGSRRRRSQKRSDSLSPPSLIRPSPPSSSRLQMSGGAETEIRTRPEAKTETHSPSTPLSFSPSESDGKSKRSKSLRKNSKKRSKEEWLEMVDELSRCQDLLKGEVENVRIYYEKLQAENLELKAKRRKLTIHCAEKEKPISEINTSLNLGLEIGQSSGTVEFPENSRFSSVVHLSPFIVNPPAYGSQFNGGLATVNHMGPLGIPDLNFSAEEVFGMNTSQPSQPLDLIRKFEKDNKAAEARRRRMIRMKETKVTAAAIRPPRSR